MNAELAATFSINSGLFLTWGARRPMYCCMHMFNKLIHVYTLIPTEDQPKQFGKITISNINYTIHKTSKNNHARNNGKTSTKRIILWYDGYYCIAHIDEKSEYTY